MLAERIAALLPAHRHYVEPFAGSLAVLLAKAPSTFETVNDIDDDLMLFWRVLRDRPDELVAAAALTPHARAEHLAARDRDGLDDVERARRVWVLLSQGRTGTLLKTGWRYMANPSPGVGMPAYLGAYVDRMPPAAWRLRQVSLECRPALDVIADYGQHADVCLYVDPPYDGTTRSTGYRHEMREPAEHEALSEALHACQASVVLSGYRSVFYDGLYDDWSSVEFDAFTGQGGNAGTGQRTEVLWSNREIANRTLFTEVVA